MKQEPGMSWRDRVALREGSASDRAEETRGKGGRRREEEELGAAPPSPSPPTSVPSAPQHLKEALCRFGEELQTRCFDISRY